MRQALSGVSARSGADFEVRAVQPVGRGKSIPAPVGGWDALSPLANMPETNAIALDNVFPQPGYIEIRKGHKRHNNFQGGSAVESLMPYHALISANDKMFAANGTIISDSTVYVSASVSSTASVAVTGLSNARWQHVNFATPGGNYLWICNGADKPHKFDGTTWTTSSVTGITSTSVINCNVFKKKIWMVLAGQMSPAYLETNAVAGSAHTFDLSGVFSKGGFLQAIGTWTLDAGTGDDDMIAFISSRGEVAVYQGTEPSSDFLLKGVYSMGAPIGRRCVQKVGGDLMVVCMDGLVPLSQGLVTDRSAAITVTMTKMIQPVMNASARAYNGNFGWQMIPYPRGTRAILNVPLVENTQQQQYVMNVVTGAWCRFTGENANCWAVFQDRLFFGGNNGLVYEADCQGFDAGQAINVNVQTSFNYADARGQQKQFTMARTILTTDGQVTPGMALDVDFATGATVFVPNSSNVVLPQWNVDNWDQGTWPQVQRVVTDWESVEGIGYCASINMQANVQATGGITAESQSLTLQIQGWDLLVIDGALL